MPILVVAVAEEPDQLVPAFSRSPASAALWPWVLPSLVRIEGDTLGRGRIEPDLALSWQAEDGGRALRFFLDTGRYWEDTTAVGASDVVQSYRLYRDPTLGGSWAPRLDEILSVDAPADGRGSVLFRFRRPLSRERALQLAALPLISSAQWEKTKDRKPALGEPGRPVHSAGPFRIEEWKQGDYIRLARNPFAPAGRSPRSEQILLRFVPSGRSRAAQLEAGIADLAIDLPVEDAAMLREESPDVRLIRAGPCAAEGILWNLDHPIWGGLALRRALKASLDLAAIRQVAAGDSDPPLVEACRGLLPGGEEAEATHEAGGREQTGREPIAGWSGGQAVARESTASESAAAAAARPDGTVDSTAVASAIDSAGASVHSTGGSSAVPSMGDSAGGAVDSTVGAVDGTAAPSAVEAPHEETPPLGDTPATATDLSYFGSPSLELLYDAANPRRERVAIEVALELDRLGVLCRLAPLSQAECARRIADRRFEAALVEWTLPALRDVGELYGRGGALNLASFADASTDSLISLARSAAADTIPDAWNRVERRATSMLPVMFYGRRIRLDGFGPQLTGYRRNPFQPYGDLLTLERLKPAPNAGDGRRGR